MITDILHFSLKQSWRSWTCSILPEKKMSPCGSTWQKSLRILLY